MKKAAFQALLSPIVADYRKRPYEYWLSRVERDPIHFQFATDSGTECQVEINAFWDDHPGGNIRVLFAIDDGGWRACLPVTDDFIITRDGTFVGE
jgi:hypothetical protein